MVDRADGRRTTLDEHLAETYCDGLCVVHDGHIVYERYFNGMTDGTAHLLMSVSKSVGAATLGVSIGNGLLAATDLVCDVAPEFVGTSLDGATVQHVIDMTAGTDFVEDYAVYGESGSDSVLIDYEREAGFRPLGDREPIGSLAHFRTYGSAYPHGAKFQYRSPLTNIAARMIEVVNGMPFADVVSRDVWGPLGQEHDADIMVDPVGSSIVEGGVSASLRDLARFGLVYLNDGVAQGRQVLPAAWVADTRHGTDQAMTCFTAGDGSGTGWDMYRNAFWVLERDLVFTGWGIFGQYCFVHRPSNTVIARFSTYPTADPGDLAAETVAALRGVCESMS